MFGLAVILTLMGPFGTGDAIGVAQRALYWGAMVVATYLTGASSHAFCSWIMPEKGAYWKEVLASMLATGVAVTTVVLSVNAVVFMNVSPGPELYWFAASVCVTAFVVSLMLSFFFWNFAGRAPVEVAPPAILKRVPIESRGRLIALSVEDHYVRVHTSAGEAMVLMRLSDAMNETKGTRGMQVHRSHWVSLDEVASARRTGDRAVLTMTSGEEVPVSRTYVPALREVGVLT